MESGRKVIKWRVGRRLKDGEWEEGFKMESGKKVGRWRVGGRL